MNEGKQSLKICGDVTGINSVISWAAKWTGLGCPDDKKITKEKYIAKMFSPDDIRKYALMNYEERESQCMRSTSGQYLGCMYYYTGGPKACRMDNANPQCDDIMKTFRQMVLDYQNTIVKEAIASCSKVADGCKGENNLPLVIDTYGLLPTGDCLNKGIKNFSPDCKPKEQPCCKIAPVGPIRCDKAKSQAANQMGSGFRAIVEQAFGKVTETYANDKMKADLKSCRDTILGGLLASVQSFACNAAMALPEATYDISVIWPGVLQQATDKAVADDKGNCIGPYVHMQKYGECVYKCNPSIALGTTYNTADPSIVNCKNNCKATYFVPQGILDLKETTPAGTTSVPIPSSDKTKEIGTKQPMPEMRKPKDIKPIEPIKPIPAPVPVPGVR